MEYNNISEKEWLGLLKNAIDENVKIQVNFRFTYKGKNLGSFLGLAKRGNDAELIKKIEDLGVDFKMYSRKNPEHYLEKFILQLSSEKTPNKQSYITRFNTYVLPKKELLKEETIAKLNSVWKIKFEDTRKWEKPDTIVNKIEKWKEFRYNEEINPNGKWFDYRKNMGKLYGWVYVRKRNPTKMKEIINFFEKNEIIELKKEGFRTRNKSK